MGSVRMCCQADTLRSVGTRAGDPVFVVSVYLLASCDENFLIGTRIATKGRESLVTATDAHTTSSWAEAIYGSAD